MKKIILLLFLLILLIGCAHTDKYYSQEYVDRLGEMSFKLGVFTYMECAGPAYMEVATGDRDIRYIVSKQVDCVRRKAKDAGYNID
jgi:hypothetical protein